MKIDVEGFRVTGGERIKGETRLKAAKNAVLPIMAASVLCPGTTGIMDCPDISDVTNMAEILRGLGCKTRRAGALVEIDAEHLTGHVMPDAPSKRLRSSIFMLGSLLGRRGRATATYPGGCEIGMRPIDLHLSGLRALGVSVLEEGGALYFDGAHMHAADVHFDYPSVGATENVMLAAVLLDGKTTIHNAAREPEIEDLQRFINAMGGRVSGAGTQRIEVEGVSALKPIAFTPVPDRIVGGTLLCAAAITGGEITLLNARPGDMVAILSKLREMGCDVREERDSITLTAPERLRAFEQLQTQPHPGFPTDMQVQMLTLASVARGTSVVVENVFENRFMHAADLNRMGANIRLSGRAAIIQGVSELHGMPVSARDLRGGASLVLAGLCAKGETLVERADYIRRGYEHLDETLRALGARIVPM